jgi:hypothetical protein
MSAAALAISDTPDFLTILLLLLGILLVMYTSLFLHELGHALLGRWSGFLVTSFGVGTGELFWVSRWRGTRIYLGLRGSLGLTVYLIPQIYPTRRQLVVTYCGGIWAHVLLVLAGLWLWQNVSWGGPLWLALVGLNGVALVVNVVPVKVRLGGALLSNDGWCILEVLRLGMPEPNLPGQLNTLRALQPLFTAIKDVRGHHIYLLSGALAWSALGNAARARQLLNEATLLPLDPTPFDLAFRALVRGLTARAAGDLPAAAEALEEAARRFAQPAHEVGLFVIAWGRANLLACQGNVAEALRQLEALAEHPIAVARPLLRTALLADRLCALARLPEGTSLEALLKEYEATRKAHPSAPRDLQVYKAVVASYQLAGQPETAGRACAQALKAARQVERSLSHEEDRGFFRQGQEELVQLAHALDGYLGEGAPRPNALWLTAAELQQEATALQDRRSRRLFRMGWLVIAVNFALGAALAAPFLLSPRPTVRDEDERDAIVERLFPPILLLGGTLFAAVASLGWLLLGRAFPSLRRYAGVVTFWLSLLPYVMLLQWRLGWLAR